MGRWATEYMHLRTSVSEHIFSVTQIGQMLAVIEEQYGNTINWKKLFIKLINHDVPEAMTGDIINTTKHKNKQIKNMVDAIERELVEEVLIKALDEPFQQIYREFLLEGKDDTLEGQILKYADTIDALLECIYELKLNNTETFKDKYYTLLSKLEESNLESVKYFLKKILPNIVKDIDCI